MKKICDKNQRIYPENLLKREVKKFKTRREQIGNNIFKLISFMWYWYWWRSHKESWEGFLNSRTHWVREMGTIDFFDPDSSNTLKEMIKKSHLDYMENNPPNVGYHGNGVYHLGGGTYVGEEGWKTFIKESEK